MKFFKNSFILSLVALIGFSLLPKNVTVSVNPYVYSLRETPVKIAAVMFDIYDPYPSQVIHNLKIIQGKNEGKVEFTFFNSNYNEKSESEHIDSIISSKQYNVIMVDLVNINFVEKIVSKIKTSNMPLIIFHNEPYNMDSIKSYNKSIFIGSNPEEGGILQGQILVNEWNKHKNIVDHDRDNIMEYILLKGKTNSLDTIGRSKASIATLRSSGINTYELASPNCNWEKEEGKKATEALLLQFGDKIEVINSNNDYMAIGAIEALQSYGYNKGDNSRTIPVVGVDGIPEAIELIDKGFMTNTVIQDAKGTAEALYICAMNFALGKKPTEGTNYRYDDSGIAIRIPYTIYKPLD